MTSYPQDASCRHQRGRMIHHGHQTLNFFKQNAILPLQENCVRNSLCVFCCERGGTSE